MYGIPIKDILTYGISVLAIGYVVHVMLHPELDETPPQRESPGVERSEAEVFRWCAERWRDTNSDSNLVSASERRC